MCTDRYYNTILRNRQHAFEFLEYKDYIGFSACGEGLNFEVMSETNYMCANEFGTTLASIHSSSNDSDILHIMDELEFNASGSSGYAWIGLNDINIEGTYSWTDSTVYDYNTYNNWYSSSDAFNQQESRDWIVTSVDNNDNGAWFNLVTKIDDLDRNF